MKNVYSRLGILSIYHPGNISGSYDLVLSQQAHYMIAHRLLESFRQQYDDGHCSLPVLSCFPYFKINGKEDFVANPHDINLPLKGEAEVTKEKGSCAYLHSSSWGHAKASNENGAFANSFCQLTESCSSVAYDNQLQTSPLEKYYAVIAMKKWHAKLYSQATGTLCGR